jgi:hypothetical protein
VWRLRNPRKTHRCRSKSSSAFRSKATTIRVKFSRDANPVSFADRIRASYSKEESAERGEAQPPPISFTTSYSSSTQVLEIAPRQPLERFRQVRVELLQGIVGQDGSVLRAWSLRFRTGGS